VATGGRGRVGGGVLQRLAGWWGLSANRVGAERGASQRGARDGGGGGPRDDAGGPGERAIPQGIPRPSAQTSKTEEGRGCRQHKGWLHMQFAPERGLLSAERLNFVGDCISSSLCE